MKNNFDSKEFIDKIAIKLIETFEGSSNANHPYHVGIIKENAVRKQFQSLLPNYISVGEGFVIDSNSEISNQIDIVLYEKEICPAFDIEAGETRYYPCEGVCAVGEIKSILSTKELEDSFQKIESVKSRKRKVIQEGSYRNYGSTLSVISADTSINNPDFQIYGFILCQEFGLKIETLMNSIIKFQKTLPTHLIPNVIASLKDGIIINGYYNGKEYSFISDLKKANALYYCKNPQGSFQYLLYQLNSHFQKGITVSDSPITNYILKDDRLSILNMIPYSQSI